MTEPIIVPEPIPAPAPAPAAPESKPFADFVPTEFKDKPWAKDNMADPTNFFKFVDNQNTLVGKKGVILPEEGASPEKVNEYLKAIGRPDTADEYDLTPIEELKDTKKDEEFAKSVKGLFHQVGVPKSMATKLSQGFEKMIYEKNKVALDAQKAEDAAFEKLNTEFFGDKREEVVANAQKILKEVLPKEMLPAFDKMSVEQLAGIIAITDSVYKKFGKEDGFKGGLPGAGPSGGESYEALSAQQRELMKNPAYSDWRHAEHAAVAGKNTLLLEKMRAIKK